MFQIEGKMSAKNSTNKTQKTSIPGIVEFIGKILLWIGLFGIGFSVYKLGKTPIIEPKLTTISKGNLKNNIKTLIMKDASLDQMNHYLSQLKKESASQLKALFSQNKFYSNQIMLKTIIKDIELDALLDTTNTDQEFIEFNRILKEIERKDPFEKLNFEQRIYFQNIALILGENYKSIKTVVEKISEELIKVNEINTIYLRDAKESKFISYVGLVITIIGIILSHFYQVRALYQRIIHG